MRILQVNDIFNPEVASGPANAAYAISKELVKKGHKVVFYASDMKDKYTQGICGTEVVDGIEVHRLKTVWPILSRTLKICFTPSLMAISSGNLRRFDVVHLHGYRSFQNTFIAQYARKYGVPYVLQPRAQLPRIMAKQKLKWIYDVFYGHRLLRGASKVIALGQTEVQQYNDMGAPEEKIAVIFNGIDLGEYRDLPPRGSFRSKFSIGEDKKIILYLGRIHKIKGIDFLVKAYAHLLEKLKFNNALLVIAGPDDGHLGELKQLLSSLKMITNDVLFTGPLYGKDKLEAYVDADVFVLPSRYEGFPLVILEAYACSKPVIASDVKSIPDIVLHGKTGLLFQAGDVQELGKAITYMLTHPEEAEKMGREARKLVEEKFSLVKIVGSLEALYQEVLEEKTKGIGHAET